MPFDPAAVWNVLTGMAIAVTLWGIAGAFIGVPILIALVSLCARNPATRGIAIALSADAATDDRAHR